MSVANLSPSTPLSAGPGDTPTTGEGEEFNVVTNYNQSPTASTPTVGPAAGQGVSSQLLKDSLVANAPETSLSPGGTADSLLNAKERRKSSISKRFLGDYCQVAINPAITKVMKKNGDNRVEFSDVVIKINKRNKMQERLLLVTENALYNIDPTSLKVKRRIPFNELGSISLSKLADNFFCLHVPSEYDYLLVCNKKTEIVCKVAELYEKAVGSKLRTDLANSFEYKIDTDVYREIVFAAVDGGISTQIFTKSKKGGVRK